MITSLKNNKAIRGNKRKAFKDHPVSHKSKKPLVFKKKMTTEELTAFKNKLIKERRRKDIIRTIVIILALSITVYFCYFMLNL